MTTGNGRCRRRITPRPGYSELDQINGSTVKNLRVDFTFSLGVDKGEEAAPIIVGDTMYIVTAYPELRLRARPRASRVPRSNGLSSRSPSPPLKASPAATSSIAAGSLPTASSSSTRSTATPSRSMPRPESSLWKTKLGDINIGESITMAPFVVKGKVLVGNSGGEFGVRGWLAALDANTGKIVWKAFSTGPDKDVLIGPDFHPFYPVRQRHGSRRQTWPPDAWKIGGGTMWGWIAYDPDLNLIFHGTGNPGPWNQEQRPGRQQMDRGRVRPRPGHRRGEMVLPNQSARRARL